MKQRSAQTTDPEALALARQEVRDMLLRSEAFRALPAAAQREIANNTVQVASYLAAPEGIKANKLPNVSVRKANTNDPYAFPLADTPARMRQSSTTNGEGQFTAQAASEGARVAGALLNAVNFPNFVSGLIQGVFHSIVQSSIEQMEAYGRLVADVAKTLNQFRDENVSPNQGRDHLVDQFPDLFMVDIDTGGFDGSSGPRVRLRDNVDEDAALKRVNSLPIEGGPLSSLDDDSIEEKLVPAARTQLATSRQQLLATMVLMGINRIVVTDGKIAAKVMYDFKANDNFRFQRSATQFDYAKDSSGNLQRMGTEEREGEVKSKEGDYSYSSEGDFEDRGGSYYAKGKYKYTEQPVITTMFASNETTDASLQTKANLSGVVEVNFKSDYFPLEKMADSFQIGMIQEAAKPGQAKASRTPTQNNQAASAPTTAPANQPAGAAR